VRVLICYFKSNIPIEILQALVAVACAVGIDQRKLNHKNGHTCIDALLIKHDLVKAFFVCFDFYTCLFYFGLLSLLSYCHESQRNGISAFCPREKWCERQKEKRGGGKKPSFPSPTPLFRFLALAPFFRAGKTPKIPFLGLSLSQTPRKRLLRRLWRNLSYAS